MFLRVLRSTAIGIVSWLAAMFIVWFPEFELWYVDPKPITTEEIELAREEPAQPLINELVQMGLKPLVATDNSDIKIRRAEKLLRGVLSLDGFPDAHVSRVFSPSDLGRGSEKWRLIFASLVGVDQLLDAYATTGNEKYFDLARQNIVAFARFESTRWLDVGYLWNDHAIAARIPVLIKFWMNFRQRSDFDTELGKLVLNLVARSGLLLAKPEHYSWRTGHGIVQNLALLQIGLGFPSLKERDYFRATAKRRLAAHIPYYVNREGVTLLHSAGYAVGGVRYLSMAMRMYTLAGDPIPADWWTRLNGAKDFLTFLRRPDDTLPMFGDTGNSPIPSGNPAQTWADASGRAHQLRAPEAQYFHSGMSLFPESGYAGWWYPNGATVSSTRRQTIAVWSNYPGLGHKYADELSVLIWGSGRSWITNVGYWPYGLPGRAQAESWEGSNAPHLRGEPATSDRVSRLLSSGADTEHHYVEMVRNGPNGFSVQRALLQLKADTWLVLDQYRDTESREVEAIWTFYPDLQVLPGHAPSSFNVSSPDKSSVMQCLFQSSATTSVEHLSGSSHPFAGWVVIGETPQPASSIRVRSTSQGGWQLTICTLRKSGAVAESGDLAASLSVGEDRMHWTARLNRSGTPHSVTISRSQDGVSIVDEAARSSGGHMLSLREASDPTRGIASVLAAFQESTDRSIRRVPLIPYRKRIGYLLLALLLVQETLLFAARRRWPRLTIGLRTATVSAWIGGGWCLNSFYFVAG